MRKSGKRVLTLSEMNVFHAIAGQEFGGIPQSAAEEARQSQLPVLEHLTSHVRAELFSARVVNAPALCEWRGEDDHGDAAGSPTAPAITRRDRATRRNTENATQSE